MLLVYIFCGCCCCAYNNNNLKIEIILCNNKVVLCKSYRLSLASGIIEITTVTAQTMRTEQELST